MPALAVIASAAPGAGVWAQALLAVTGVSLISLVGIVTFVVRQEALDRVMPYIVGAAAGALLGAAFFDLVPHVAHENGFTPLDSACVLAGMIVFFAFERYIHWHQHGHAHGHAVVAPYVWMNLAGDGLHNFVDGAVIAVSFLDSPALGITTTVAVALHEIPQEMGDMGVLISGGLSRARALGLNLATALTALVGCVAGLLVGQHLAGFEHAALAFTAGGFVYIAAADLMPELHRHEHGWPSVLQLACLVAGAGVMGLFAD